MTYNEAVSMIQEAFNAVSKDTYIPRRFILSVLKSKADILMAQRFNDKSLFRETNLYKWVRCISLEEVDTVRCGKVELQKCSTAMVSVKCLPKLIWSRYGASILMVTNITDDKEYTLTTPDEYIEKRKRRGFEKFMGRYAIVYPDGKIAIPDSTVKKINVLLYTLDENADDCSECSDEKDSCKNYWDSEFNVPDKLRDIAIAQAAQFISPRLNIRKDENPNNDSNIISREQE
jgi:hypothetical protein